MDLPHRQLTATQTTLAGRALPHRQGVAKLWRDPHPYWPIVAPPANQLDIPLRGELRPDIDPEVVLPILIGSTFARHLAGLSEDEAWLNSMIDTVWSGIAAGAG